MRKVQNFGDDRNKGTCVHCGGPNETRDHAPSVVFLDDPLPPDLSASPSCASCNQGFSNDEAYLACLLECVMAGSTDSSMVERKKITALMLRRPSLVAELSCLRHEDQRTTTFSFDKERVKRVILKLARCHVAFELNEPRTDEPEYVWFTPLSSMSRGARDEFEGVGERNFAGWPEVGSRAMQRIPVFEDTVFIDDDGWLEVQEGRYRFRPYADGGVGVSIVLREYLACKVWWD